MKKSMVIGDKPISNINRTKKVMLLDVNGAKNNTGLTIINNLHAVDVLKFRVQRNNNTTGNISVLDAPELYRNILRLLYISAADIKNPKRYHKGNYGERFNDYVRKCQFGQTEKGSYIVKVYLPLEADIDNEGYEPLFAEDCYRDSMGRQISSKIMKSMNTIKTAIDEKNEKELTEGFESNAISGNMYEAIAGLTLSNEETIVEVSAEWAPVAPNEECDCSQVTFTDDYYEPLREISGKLKQTSCEDINIVGYVGCVRAKSDYAKRTQGTVYIDYHDDEKGKNSSIKVTLDIENYSLATEAHQKGYQIKLMGKMNDDGSVTCTSFEIIDIKYAPNATQGILFPYLEE